MTTITQQDIEIFSKNLSRRVLDSGNPNTLSIYELLRDIKLLCFNSKVLSSYIASIEYSPHIDEIFFQKLPGVFELKGRLCKQIDFDSYWLKYWLIKLKNQLHLNRKLWEDAYIIQSVWENNMLKAEISALGFAVGIEPLPSLFSSFGVKVLASDLSSDDSRSLGWKSTNQHSESLTQLFRNNLVSKEVFNRNCQFRNIDMNKIPSDLDGKFDFCWSVCSLEHLGSISNGLNFICNAMRTLKPGGIAFHTTEFNLDPTETIDNWGTVLFQKKHFIQLREMLEKQGDSLDEIDFDPGGGLFDQLIDVPPFPHDERLSMHHPSPPHLKLSVDGFPVTSIGFIARRGTDHLQ